MSWAPTPAQVMPALEELRRQQLVEAGDATAVQLSRAGRTAHARLVTARREALDELATGWRPDDQAEVGRLLDRLAHEFVREIPRAQAPSPASG